MHHFSARVRCTALSFMLGQCLSAQSAIEAVVTRKGEIVRGLQPGDIRLWVDGKLQAVASVEERSKSPGTQRFAIVFDHATLAAGDLSQIRREVAAFIDSSAGSGRVFAVVKWFTGMEVVLPFTGDAARLRSTIEGMGASAATSAGSPGALTSGYSSDTSGRTSGGALGPNSLSSAGSVERMLNLMGSLAGLCDSLAPMRGRKSVFFITGGGYAMSPWAELERSIDRAMDACNRADVALHGVSNDASFSDLLSSRTGGSSLRLTESLGGSLKRIADEEDSSWLIAFSPPQGKRGCYPVRLEVPKGLQVRWRKKYCAQ